MTKKRIGMPKKENRDAKSIRMTKAFECQKHSDYKKILFTLRKYKPDRNSILRMNNQVGLTKFD